MLFMIRPGPPNSSRYYTSTPEAFAFCNVGKFFGASAISYSRSLARSLPCLHCPHVCASAQSLVRAGISWSAICGRTQVLRSTTSLIAVARRWKAFHRVAKDRMDIPWLNDWPIGVGKLKDLRYPPLFRQG